MHKKGFVYLVGAGCGSADLITVRGLRLLQSCDAVVYDDLIDPALLAQAAHAEQHPAGKRCGRHSMPQSEINSLLVRLGQSGKTVVRLKGGDPFVFGRGGEEFLALQAAGVPCEEVPGISSCIAVPAAAGIPVTHRGASRSFHVITGHTAQTGDTLPESLEALAALHGTLVFLMGLNSLEQIAALKVLEHHAVGRGKRLDKDLVLLLVERSVEIVAAPLLLVARLREQHVHIERGGIDDRRRGIEERKGVATDELHDLFAQRRRAQGAGGNDHVTFGNLRDLAVNDLDIGTGGNLGLDKLGKLDAVDRQGTAGGNSRAMGAIEQD